MNRRAFYIGLLAPGLIILVLVIGYPTILTFYYSATNLHIYHPPGVFIGLRNYLEIFGSESELYPALLSNIVWTAASVVFQLFFGMIAALCLSGIRRGVSLFRILLFVPWTFPAVSLAFSWKWMLEPAIGIVNYFLIRLGIIAGPIGWFGDMSRAMLSVIAMNIWFGVPYMIISIVAGLDSIPADVYDSAKIDGANDWQTFWQITIPMLARILLVVVSLRVLWVFNNFSFVFMTTGGGPNNRTNILPVLIYQVGFREGWLGRASALAVVSLAILTIFAAFLLRRTDEAHE